MSPDQAMNPQNYNLYMMAVMFVLLVFTTYVGPGQGSRTLLMLVASGFLCGMAYISGSFLLALGVAWICGLLSYHLVTIVFDHVFRR